MERYIIGASIDGIKEIGLNDGGKFKDAIVYVVLGSESNGKLQDYYRLVKQLITCKNRVILIFIGNESKIGKQLCMLMASYNMYDIYEVGSRDEIDIEYLDALIDRCPTAEEVRMFIDTDIIAYSDINDILLEIKNYINTSKSIPEHLASKVDLIDNIPTIVDYMKRIIDSINLGESEEKINMLKDEIDRLESGIKNYELRIDELNDTNQHLKNEATSAINKLKELESQLSSGPLIRTYQEVQTSLIKCKTKCVIYFKEITYVRYVNSLVIKLMEIIGKLKKLKVKLLIYDNKNAFMKVYNPIQVVGSSEYFSNKDTYVGSADKLVIAEANPAIIEDVLKDDYDVVIVYDRLKQENDIVIGNNVFKYWVLNSTQEYNSISSKFKIDKHYIITRPGVFTESLAIGEIHGYKSGTVSYRISNYLQLVNANDNKKPIIDTILDRTNVSKMAPRG